MKSVTLNPAALLAAREAKGLTQKDLADRSQLTKWGISKMEAGTRQPSAKAFKAICLALGVAREELLLADEAA